jgi:hypothetical protein
LSSKSQSNARKRDLLRQFSAKNLRISSHLKANSDSEDGRVNSPLNTPQTKLFSQTENNVEKSGLPFTQRVEIWEHLVQNVWHQVEVSLHFCAEVLVFEFLDVTPKQPLGVLPAEQVGVLLVF